MVNARTASGCITAIMHRRREDQEGRPMWPCLITLPSIRFLCSSERTAGRQPLSCWFHRGQIPTCQAHDDPNSANRWHWLSLGNGLATTAVQVSKLGHLRIRWFACAAGGLSGGSDTHPGDEVGPPRLNTKRTESSFAYFAGACGSGVSFSSPLAPQ